MNQKDKKRDPLERLLSGEKITEVVKTRRGDFTIVFPLPSTIRQIEIEISDMLGNKPLASFTQTAVNTVRVYATLRHVVVNGPDWWNDLDSPDDCSDDDFIGDLYGRYLRFYQEVQGAMAKGRYPEDAGRIPGRQPDTPAPVGDRALQGASDRPEV